MGASCVYLTIKNDLSQGNSKHHINENWCMLVGHMAQKTLTLKIKNGRSIKLSISNHEKKYIVSEVIEEDCYFPKIGRHDFNLRPNDTVIDVGANVGIFTVYAATLASKGKIYAFEPVKSNFNHLTKNIALNKLKNVIIERVGISDSKRETTIFLERSNTGGHSLYKEKYENIETIRGTETINLITLQEVFDRYKIKNCNFLKIDCEGSEFDVIKGLPDSYFGKIDKIVLEFHPNVDEIELARYLIGKGYKVTIHHLDRILGMIFAHK
jgi:FkbM family methyltransferase